MTFRCQPCGIAIVPTAERDQLQRCTHLRFSCHGAESAITLTDSIADPDSSRWASEPGDVTVFGSAQQGHGPGNEDRR